MCTRLDIHRNCEPADMVLGKEIVSSARIDPKLAFIPLI